MSTSVIDICAFLWSPTDTYGLGLTAVSNGRDAGAHRARRIARLPRAVRDHPVTLQLSHEHLAGLEGGLRDIGTPL